MFQGIGSLIIASRKFQFDSDASAFFTATGITDSTQKMAINTLVIAAKANGWWTLCNAIYPMVGGTATTHKYNLKDPRDLDAAFRITFNGSWTHSSTGALPDASTAYGNTFLTPSTTLTLYDSHISYYSGTSEAGASKYEIGVRTIATNANLYMLIYNAGLSYNGSQYGGVTLTSFNPTVSTGYYLDTRTSSTLQRAFKNGSTANSNTTTETSGLSTHTIFIGARNLSGVANGFSGKECRFATIGAGINNTIAASMYTDIQNFQTSLSRQI